MARKVEFSEVFAHTEAMVEHQEKPFRKKICLNGKPINENIPSTRVRRGDINFETLPLCQGMTRMVDSFYHIHLWASLKTYC